MQQTNRILQFRGWNAKNQTWLYGSYTKNRGFHFICPDEFAEDKTWEDYEVDPATVGQFSGCYDKTGAMVYEDDIVDAWSAGSHVTNGIIHFGACHFLILLTSDKGPYGHWHLAPSQFDGNDEHLRVVGNIHDNPDLVKGYLEYEAKHKTT